MDGQTIKVSLESIEIPAILFYVHVLSILLVLLLARYSVGKYISRVGEFAIQKYKDSHSKLTYPDWTAVCKDSKHWPQKQAAQGLDLKGRYLKSLEFTIEPMGSPQHWRAGFVLGNEKLQAHGIVDTKNGVTIHTGSDLDSQEKILPIWKFYNNFEQNNPDISTVQSPSPKEIAFSVSINEKNFMNVKAQNEAILYHRIDSSFRRRVYLKAWCDNSPDIKIKFKDISYILWGEY